MAIETLRPNAAGDECNIDEETGAACPNHYQNVDEVEHDGDTTRVETDSASWLRDLYNITDHSEGSGTINHIVVRAYCRKESGYGTRLKIAIKSGTGSGDPDTVSESPEKGLTYSYANQYHQWDTNPATGSAWTWDEIDKLQTGVALRQGDNASYSYCTQVYVEVDYTAVTEKTSSDSGSGVDAYVSLETPEAKTSSDSGSGVEGTPLPSATLAGSETGSGIEAPVARLLAVVDTGYGVEAGDVEVEGLLKNLFANELGRGSDSLTAKIETPTKGGGMKLWI